MAESKQITSEQVQYLFTFVEKKRVRYYDMQVELVDHLACSIEELWIDNPDLPFEQALQRIYKRFGITGFSKVLQEKRKAVEKQTWRWIGQFLLSWVKFPKVFLTVAILFSMTQILAWTRNPAMVAQIILLSTVVLAFVALLYNWYQRGLHKKRKKLLFVEAAMSPFGALGGAAGLLFQIPDWTLREGPQSMGWIVAIVIFIFLTTLFLYATYVEIPRKVQAKLEQQFPKFA